MGYAYTRIDGERVEVHVAAGFYALKRAFELAHPGITLHVSSGVRTRDEQADLYRRYKAGTYPYLVAPPGSSNHEETGPVGPRAIDIRDSGSDAGVAVRGSARDRWMEQNAGRYGFDNAGYRFSKVEAWHKEKRGSLEGDVPAWAGQGALAGQKEDDMFSQDDRNVLGELKNALLDGTIGVQGTAHAASRQPSGAFLVVYEKPSDKVRNGIVLAAPGYWHKFTEEEWTHLSSLRADTGKPITDRFPIIKPTNPRSYDLYRNVCLDIVEKAAGK